VFYRVAVPRHARYCHGKKLVPSNFSCLKFEKARKVSAASVSLVWTQKLLLALKELKEPVLCLLVLLLLKICAGNKLKW
jgi:hypothetical protein